MPRFPQSRHRHAPHLRGVAVHLSGAGRTSTSIHSFEPRMRSVCSGTSGPVAGRNRHQLRALLSAPVRNSMPHLERNGAWGAWCRRGEEALVCPTQICEHKCQVFLVPPVAVQIPLQPGFLIADRHSTARNHPRRSYLERVVPECQWWPWPRRSARVPQSTKDRNYGIASRCP